MTARTGHLGQDTWDSTAMTGKYRTRCGQASWNSQPGQCEQEAGVLQPVQYSRCNTAGTVQPGHVSMDRLSWTGQPGQVSRYRAEKTEG
jgi:hypothetical protein